MAAITETTHEAPPVRFAPCAAFRSHPDAPLPACDECGWLEHDHAGPDALGDSVVTVLPRRVVAIPQRLAS
jgi:hypothetical protein